MRKLTVLLALVFVATSCGPKVVRESKKVIKGYWELNEITYSETGTFNITMLQDTSKECFEGSSWRFIPNNNTGVYSITDSNCPTGDRNFIFTIQQIDPETGLYDFLLKPTDAKNKSVDNRGFRFKLTRLTGSNMSWEQTVSLEGSPFTIYMNFSKTSD